MGSGHPQEREWPDTRGLTAIGPRVVSKNYTMRRRHANALARGAAMFTQAEAPR